MSELINVDKNATYPAAIDKLFADHPLTKTTELRRVMYLNNIWAQDHRFIKWLVNPEMEFVGLSYSLSRDWAADYVLWIGANLLSRRVFHHTLPRLVILTTHHSWHIWHIVHH